jgi:hypothetical protein
VTAAAWAQTYRRLSYGEASRSGQAAGDSGTAGWLAHRRLKAYPSSVEAETAALFLAPLLLPRAGIVIVLMAAYAFYAVSILDNIRRTYRRARLGRTAA